MAGLNNFLVFNEDYSNLTSDVNYESNVARQNGVTNGIADTLLHNKLYRQVSVMAAAMAAAMANKNYDVLDSDMSILTSILGSLQTLDEIRFLSFT